MRQDRGWSQKELAERAGTTQEGVSRLENPNYGKFTLTTLIRLASVFDVGLDVDFVPFSRLVDKAANRSRDDFHVSDYDHDPGLADSGDDLGIIGTAEAMTPFQGVTTGQDMVYAHVPYRSMLRPTSVSNTAYTLDLNDEMAEGVGDVR